MNDIVSNSRNRFGLPDNINNDNIIFLSLKNAHLIEQQFEPVIRVDKRSV